MAITSSSSVFDRVVRISSMRSSRSLFSNVMRTSPSFTLLFSSTTVRICVAKFASSPSLCFLFATMVPFRRRPSVMSPRTTRYVRSGSLVAVEALLSAETVFCRYTRTP